MIISDQQKAIFENIKNDKKAQRDGERAGKARARANIRAARMSKISIGRASSKRSITIGRGIIGRAAKSGRGFKGIFDYAIAGQKNASIIESNCGSTPAVACHSMIQISSQRPDVSKPVLHLSFSLPPSTKIDEKRWSEIAKTAIHDMGLEDFPHIAIRHQDRDHDHIHIIASRVNTNSDVFDDYRMGLRTMAAASTIENTHNLPRVFNKNASLAPSAGLKKNESEKAIREQKIPTRKQIENILDSVLIDNPTLPRFVERLNAKGISVLPNIARNGTVSGLSFQLDGLTFKGSQIGTSKKNSWSNLQKEVGYDEIRDVEFLVGIEELGAIGQLQEFAKKRERLAGVTIEASKLIEQSITELKKNGGEISTPVPSNSKPVPAKVNGIGKENREEDKRDQSTFAKNENLRDRLGNHIVDHLMSESHTHINPILPPASPSKSFGEARLNTAGKTLAITKSNGGIAIFDALNDDQIEELLRDVAKLGELKVSGKDSPKIKAIANKLNIKIKKSQEEIDDELIKSATEYKENNANYRPSNDEFKAVGRKIIQEEKERHDQMGYEQNANSNDEFPPKFN